MITKCLYATSDTDAREFFTDENNFERLIENFIDIQHIMHTFNEAWLCKAEMSQAGYLMRTEFICPIQF